ncbi:MAG: hypothetical protein HY305_03095, partial [Sphingobacteriales bacterium]|nr:hypothetical protein [Sphingobacteriales bacterium]
MKSSNLIVIAFLLIFLSSCSNDREKVLILSLTEGLVKSTETVHQENARLYMIMKEREADPVTQEKYARWAPKIEMLKTESKELGSYIDTIKKGVTENKKFSDGEVLYKKLASFRRDILNIDSPYIEHHFKNILSIVSASYDLSGKNAKDFSNTFFNAASKENTLAILTKLQNNIALLENAALSYLNYTTAIHGCIFRYKPFAAIINQNAKHLKAGDELEINAGVGEFND